MGTYEASQTQPPDRQQSRAVAVLVATLAVLITVWIVGAILLINYAPNLGELPNTSPSNPSPGGD
jgi:hypothetical protein